MRQLLAAELPLLLRVSEASERTLSALLAAASYPRIGNIVVDHGFQI
ncbi:MAG: hypothetical protein V2I41_03100 [Pseudomonadales bacterium]|nr:hypothetical protein [Pseudomonadales bacterium]